MERTDDEALWPGGSNVRPYRGGEECAGSPALKEGG